MKLLILTLQALLALWNIVGASYLIGNYRFLANVWAQNHLPAFFWYALGALQIILAIALLLSISGRWRKLALPAATGLTLTSLLGLAIYAAYWGFPGMLWALIPASLLAGIAAYHKAH